MKGMMKALWYNAPKDFVIKQVPIPQINDDEVLLKGEHLYCNLAPFKLKLFFRVCGTDGHIDEGEFISQFPLIPGHEAIGTIVEMGKNVKGFSIGDRCVADVGITCENCFYCRRGQSLLCEDFHACGVTQDGGFAEYIKYQQKKLYKIHNLTDEESTLLEPAACAIHGLDKLNPGVGIEVLLMGAGPTGLILAQLLKQNGASRVVIAANKGIKMDIAKKLNAADEYIELDRQAPEAQWQKLKADNPYGFDVVVEATGVEKLANESINYVRRGGTLMIYGVYEDKALVHWPPAKIFGDEIRIIGSFSQTFCFPRAVAYLDGGKINLKGMVTDVFKLDDYQAALDKMNSRGALKIAIKP
ncbi:N-terminal acetyltransferase A complex catalytic subunit ard1 [Psilocybe cubensis]|uniref:N-terminal acetyltransferase A complex catalytic subunit ard1 n=2 Tax=Psilocybe cubensis TaxID=181762 RepID=A0ACB8GQ85_PSICU|nr:N-terminal acetyltransferase A complex catalytic subunit ard1 [Psilocybe cubensis]KAH9477816.1 N-terminal acetyltransferase A complex catalytic subunit ard1 [Psilocybe cubensis]